MRRLLIPRIIYLSGCLHRLMLKTNVIFNLMSFCVYWKYIHYWIIFDMRRKLQAQNNSGGIPNFKISLVQLTSLTDPFYSPVGLRT